MGEATSRAPDGLRVTVLHRGEQELLVLSYPERPFDDLCEETPLSPAEAEVASSAIRGRSNAEIAEARGTSVRTVANQMASILRKLGLESRRELAARFARGDLPRR